MERAEALAALRHLVGVDLRELAEQHRITVWTPHVLPGVRPSLGSTLNKGWAGQAIERHLGLPLNSSRSPNLGSWELKQVSLARRQDGTLRVKETMAITMLDRVEVGAKAFEESHLYTKLRRIVVVAREYCGKDELTSTVHSVGSFQLDDPAILSQVREDYEEVRRVLREQGYAALSGRMGKLVQPRTKGPGHGSDSRAFYARTGFVAHILGLAKD